MGVLIVGAGGQGAPCASILARDEVVSSIVLADIDLDLAVIGGSTYLLEMAPSIERVLYMSFANGIVGLVFLASPLGGAIVDWLVFELLFLFSLACSLIATFYSMGLEEPRQKQV